MTTRSRTIGQLTLAAGLALASVVACKGQDDSKDSKAKSNDAEPNTDSKEAEACRHGETLSAAALGMAVREVSPRVLARCIEKWKAKRVELGEEKYQALLDCELAAKTADELFECEFGPMPDPEVQGAQARAELDAHFAKVEQETAENNRVAIKALEAHVASGAVSAATIEALRNPGEGVVPGRIDEIANDAVAIIEAGRLAPGTELTVRLQQVAGLGPKPEGLAGAELSFVDKDSGATVGRLPLMSVDYIGAKADQVAALFDWMLESPDDRRVELIVTTAEEDFHFDPPAALLTAIPRFEAAGIADRPVIWLDGKPLTLTQYRDR